MLNHNILIIFSLSLSLRKCVCAPACDTMDLPVLYAESIRLQIKTIKQHSTMTRKLQHTTTVMTVLLQWCNADMCTRCKQSCLVPDARMQRQPLRCWLSSMSNQAQESVLAQANPQWAELSPPEWDASLLCQPPRLPPSPPYDYFYRWK